MQLAEYLNTRQIILRIGDYVDTIEFVMADATVKRGGYSSPGGNEQAVFDLDADEHVIGIESQQADDDPEGVLFGLRFYTSKGRESPWYGGSRGTRRMFEGTAENPIIGFVRGDGDICPKIVRVYRLNDTISGVQAAPNEKVSEVILLAQICFV